MEQCEKPAATPSEILTLLEDLTADLSDVVAAVQRLAITIHTSQTYVEPDRIDGTEN